jgi:hypothetical protein
MSKVSDALAKRGSQGGRIVPCVQCGGDIQPHAGRRVAEYADRYAHHPGQCRDTQSRAANVSSAARQGELFAWSCRMVETGETPVVCDAGGTDRAEYTSHMHAHGLKGYQSDYKRPRLGKRAPAARLGKPSVDPLGDITWHQVIYGEWQAGVGNPVLWESDRSGQYWSEGPDAHSIWVVPFTPATWETPGKPAKPVCLYAHGDGTWSADWSRAQSDRRDANRRNKRLAS